MAHPRHALTKMEHGASRAQSGAIGRNRAQSGATGHSPKVAIGQSRAQSGAIGRNRAQSAKSLQQRVDLAATVPLNLPLPRRFRIARDLRLEARVTSYPILWQVTRQGAAADDRSLNLHLESLRHERAGLLDRLRSEQRSSLGVATRIGRDQVPRTRFRIGVRGACVPHPTREALLRIGARGLTRVVNRIVEIERELAEVHSQLLDLQRVIDSTPVVLTQAAKRRFGVYRTTLMWSPHLAVEVQALGWPKAVKVDVCGPFCPTPHLAFDGWRIRMAAYSDALIAQTITLNYAYNRRRARLRGVLRKIRFGLLRQRDNYMLGRIYWAVLARTGKGAAGFTSFAHVTKRHYSGAAKSNRLYEKVEKAVDEHGRLRARAVAFANQPEMYPVLKPIDFMVSVWNELRVRGCGAFALLAGKQAVRHRFGGHPRREWKAGVEVAWWRTASTKMGKVHHSEDQKDRTLFETQTAQQTLVERGSLHKSSQVHHSEGQRKNGR